MSAQIGERLRVGSETLTFRLAGERPPAPLAMDVKMPPGGGPPALHRHDPFEIYRVQRGELAVYLENEDGAVQREVARAGDVVPIPPGREHTIRNESRESAEAFVVFTPGAEMEAFARAAADLAAAGPPDPAEVMALASRHGIEVTRPLEEASS